MRTLAAVVAVTAVLALSGCSAEARTTAAGCESVTSSWDEFTDVSTTAGRDDGDMLAARDQMLASWASVIDDSSEWTQDAVDTARDAFEKAVSDTTGAADSGEYYGTAVRELERFVAQCQTDGHLPTSYALR